MYICCRGHLCSRALPLVSLACPPPLTYSETQAKCTSLVPACTETQAKLTSLVAVLAKAIVFAVCFGCEGTLVPAAWICFAAAKCSCLQLQLGFVARLVRALVCALCVRARAWFGVCAVRVCVCLVVRALVAHEFGLALGQATKAAS